MLFFKKYKKKFKIKILLSALIELIYSGNFSNCKFSFVFIRYSGTLECGSIVIGVISFAVLFIRGEVLLDLTIFTILDINK